MRQLAETRWIAGVVVAAAALALGGCTGARASTTTIRSASLEPTPWMDAQELQRIALQAEYVIGPAASAEVEPASDETVVAPEPRPAQ